jgi:DNA-binding transcriptional MerR regulator
MSAPEIPDKLYYSISEVKQITGVEPYVLRFWETEFPSLHPRKNKKGHRTYRKKDIGLILKIKELLYKNKYTIPGARDVLSGKRVAPPAPQSPAETILVNSSDDTELLERVHRELMDLAAQLQKEKTEDLFAE